MNDDTKKIDSKVLSGFTHDLKNPIAAMQLYLEMLLKGVGGPITSKQKEMLEEITTSQEKLKNIIDTFRKEYLAKE